MTVPTSNAGLIDIQTEFGGAVSTSLSEYYAGGGYVQNPPPTSAYQTGPIPASGPISIGNFLGVKAGGVGPSPGDPWYGSESTTGMYTNTTAVARVNISFMTDGRVHITTSGTQANDPGSSWFAKNWYSPTTLDIGNSYWIRFVNVTGQIWMDDGPFPINASGQTNQPGPYTKSWTLSPQPNTWRQMTTAMGNTFVYTSITVPGSMNITLGETEILMSGTVQFAASDGGPVLYEDNFTTRSATYGI